MTKNRPLIERSVPLLDIARSGSDRRTVTAYAATFDEEYPVVDFDGDYDETINRAAFNRTLSHGIARVNVIFNHGMTLWRTPSERYSMPLGTPVEIRPDQRGLVTVTRYAKTDLADEVLELIDEGAVRFQSFRGPKIRSSPKRIGSDGRTKIERLELGLVEYGPAPFAANAGAEIVALRAAMLIEQVDELDDEDRDRLLKILQDGTPLGDPPPDPDGTPSLDPPSSDTPDTTALVPVEDSSTTAQLALENDQRRRRLEETSL